MQLNYRYVSQLIKDLPESWWSLGFIPFTDIENDSDLNTRIKNRQISPTSYIQDFKELPADLNQCINEQTDCRKLFMLNLISLKDILKYGLVPFLGIVFVLFLGLLPGMTLQDKIILWTATMVITHLLLSVLMSESDRIAREMKSMWDKIGLGSERVQFADQNINILIKRIAVIDIFVMVGIAYLVINYICRVPTLHLTQTAILGVQMVTIFIQYILVSVKYVQRLIMLKCMESMITLSNLCDRNNSTTEHNSDDKSSTNDKLLLPS